MAGNQNALELQIEPELEASAHARRAIVSVFGKQLPYRAFFDLMTVVSELVTNAVVHGPGRPISLSISLDTEAGAIRGEVVDQGDPSESIPHIREVTEGRGGGYGLRIVDRMTSEWTVAEGSTKVRFEIPLGGE